MKHLIRRFKSMLRIGGCLLGILFIAHSIAGAGMATKGPPEIAGESGIEEIQIRVDGLACPFCAFNIEKRLLHLEGVKDDDQIQVSIEAGLVSLEWMPTVTFDPEAVNEQIRRSGFTPKGIVLLATGTITRPDDAKPLRLHLVETGQTFGIVASDDPEQAARYAELESTVQKIEPGATFRAHVEGMVRQEEGFWHIVLHRWESRM